MAGIGEAVAKHADLAALVQHGLIDVLVEHHRAQRRIGRGDRLGGRDAVGADVEGGGTEHFAEPPEAADHLVGDHQHIVACEHFLDPGEIPRRWHHGPARAHHRLGNEGGDGIRALAQDLFFQFGCEAGGEFLLALALMRKPVMVRAGGVQDIGDGQIEIGMVGRQSRQRGGGDGDAVIALEAGDDLLLLRASASVIIIPDQLDLAVIGLRARRGEEHLRDRHRRDLLQLLRELDRRIVAAPGKQVLEGQFEHLLIGCFGQFPIRIAERGAPQTGHALEIGLALGIVDPDTLAALQDEWSCVAKGRELGIGMDQGFDIAGGEIGQHGSLLRLNA